MVVPKSPQNGAVDSSPTPLLRFIPKRPATSAPTAATAAQRGISHFTKRSEIPHRSTARMPRIAFAAPSGVADARPSSSP